MVISLTNTCEGTSGTALPNVNAGAPNSLDTTTKTGTGTTSTWDNAHAHGGSTSIKHHLATVASTCYEDWKASITTATANAYSRYYMYLTAYPTVTTRIVAMLSGTSLNASVQLTTTGTFRTVNSAGSVIATTTGTIPLNQWVRVEFEVLNQVTTTATINARTYSGANLEGTTADTNCTLSNASQTVVGATGDVRFGHSSSVTMTTAWDTWYDDLAWSDTAQPGPVGGGTTPVTSTRATTWVTNAAATSTRATAWDTDAAVTSTRATSWTTATATTSSRATSWATLTLASATRATSWTTAALVTSTRATAWVTNASVPSSRATTWAVLTSVTSTRATSWTVFAAVLTTRSTAWAVAATGVSVGNTRVTSWTTFATVAATRVTTWTALTPVTSTRATTWAVQTPVASTRSTSWTTAAAVLSTRATTWATRALVTSTRATSWNVAGSTTTVGSTRATSWTVRTPVLSTRATSWGVGSPSVNIAVVGDMQPGAAVNPPPSVVAAKVVAWNPDLLILPGDLANDGTTTQYGFFNTMYGALKSKHRPAPGNHDWGTSSGQATALTPYRAYHGPTPTTRARLLARSDLLYGSEVGAWQTTGSAAVTSSTIQTLVKDAQIPLIRFALLDVFSGMQRPDGTAGAASRTDLVTALDGFRNKLNAEPMIKLLPITSGSISGVEQTQFCPMPGAYDALLPYYKEVVRTAGSRCLIYESNNEMELACYAAWGFANGGSTGISTRLGQHFSANMPFLRKYARTLGFDIVTVGYAGTVGGFGWGDTTANPRTKNMEEFLQATFDAYTASGNDPDYIPDAISFHAYPHSGDFPDPATDAEIIAYYDALFPKLRTKMVNIWGSTIGNAMKIAVTEWNAGETTWAGFSDSRVSSFYTSFMACLKRNNVWEASVFAIASNPSENYDIINADGTTRTQYAAFKTAATATAAYQYPTNYSFDVKVGGTLWHIISFDSDNTTNTTGLGADPPPAVGSTVYNWMVADLAANTGKPIIAFCHHPRWSDGTATGAGGTNDDTTLTDVWNLLYDNHADLFLTGHCHSYQRFPKFNKTAGADLAGIREIVVGSGGSGLHTLNSTGRRSTVSSYQSAAYDQLNSQWFGYLRLNLTPTGYSWNFISQDGTTSLDSGSDVSNVASTTVGSSRSTSWNVRESVASTRATTWDTKAAVTDTQSTTWAVNAAVASSRATTWATQAAVSSTRATAWTVQTPALSTRATSWAVLTPALSTRATTWTTFAAATSTRATTWAVRAAVTSTRLTTWTVIAQVLSTRATAWATNALALSTRSTTWATRAAVTSTRATSWAVVGPVGNTRATTWNVAALVASSQSTTWATNARVTSTRATAWVTRAAVLSTRATSWNVAANAVVGNSRSTTWTVRAPVLSTVATTWAVNAGVTSTRSTTWATLKAVTATRTTTWTVIAQVTSTRSTSWTVVGPVGATRSTTWAVLTRTTSTRATTWAVLSLVASTRGTSWTVRLTVVSTRSTSWAATAQTGSNRSTSWAVLALTGSSRLTLWAVLTTVGSSRTTFWNVQEPSNFRDFTLVIGAPYGHPFTVGAPFTSHPFVVYPPRRS